MTAALPEPSAGLLCFHFPEQTIACAAGFLTACRKYVILIIIFPLRNIGQFKTGKRGDLHEKTIAAVTASLLLCLTCTAPEQPVCAAEGENVDIACICDNGLNISYHDYYTWTSPICSNLVPLEDGGWMRVQSSLDSQDHPRQR